MPSTAACSTAFHPDLPLPLLHHCKRSPPSLSFKPPPSSRFCVFVFVSNVMMCFYRSSYSSCSRRLARCYCLLYSCYTAVLAAPSQQNAYLWRRWCAWLPQRFGEWSSASRTFYAITALLTVTRREIATMDRLSSFFVKTDDTWMHVPPLCLRR